VPAASPTGPGVLVSQPVHQHAYETAVAAQAAGYLRYFATGLYDTGRGLADPRLRCWLPADARRRIERELRRRRHPDLDPARVLVIPQYHLVATGCRRAFDWLPQPRRENLERWAHRRFDEALARRLLALTEVQLVHAFEGAALATFGAAKAVGKLTILDIPSAHERFMDVPGEPERSRIADERTLADILLAPSDYVVACLLDAGVPQDRILTIPYGVDPATFRRKPNVRADEVFRAVFVGTVGRRKGVPHLLEAWRRLALPDAELLLVGEPDEEGRRLLKRYGGAHRFVGSVPNHEVHRFFQQSDIFVFPSQAEGSARVTYEALASELPVVTTPNSGSVVRDEIDGFLVEPGDVDGLCDRIRFLYDNPGVRRRMGAQGRELIENRYTWRHYRQRIGRLYTELLDGRDPRPAIEQDLVGHADQPAGGW
jgi:glycosyltransferase involved in cell wall biosynthesis